MLLSREQHLVVVCMFVLLFVCVCVLTCVGFYSLVLSLISGKARNVYKCVLAALVDLLFCRFLTNNFTLRTELGVHNRESGKFFLIDTTDDVVRHWG